MTETGRSIGAQEAAALLMSGTDGVARWNRMRGAGERVPLTISLTSLDGDQPLDLRGADLGGCDLQGSDLSYANMTGAYLHRARLDGVSLTGAKLSRAHLAEAILAGAQIRGTVFDHAILREAVLVQAVGPARFTSALMERADLRQARLECSDFGGAKLVDANLEGASLEEAHLIGTDLRRANMRGVRLGRSRLPDGMEFDQRARLDRANLSGADLQGARMAGASLRGADCTGTNLRETDLTASILDQARMIDTRMEGAALTGSSVFGISAWGLLTDADTRQRDLNISRHGDSPITVDDLEVAQFMYLLMNNARLRSVIDTITSKVVLILGRFTADRKPVLDALRNTLRGADFDFVPIVFDFDRPASRTTSETVATLAGMARFVIADLTDAKSVLQELREIVPSSPSLPVQPLLLGSQDEPGMLDSFLRYPWFLEPHRYDSLEELLGQLDDILQPAVAMSRLTKGDEPETEARGV